MSEFKKDYKQSMDSLHFSENAKFRMTEKLCQKSLRSRKGNNMNKKFVLILAAVLIIAALCGAAFHVFWSNTLTLTANTSQSQRIAAEHSGLSSKPAKNAQDTDTVSVTEQGVTVSVEQVIADKHSAEVALVISGFELADGEFPDIYGMGAELGGEEIFTSLSGSFYDGITVNENGESVYDDGTPVKLNSEGCSISRFADSDGNFRFRMTMKTQKDMDKYKGQPLKVWISNLGTGDKGEHRTDIEATWTLSWPFEGSGEIRELEVNKPIGSSGNTLKDVQLTPLEINTVVQLSEPFDGWETLDFLSPRLEGYRTSDGIIHNSLLPGTEGYIDKETLLAKQNTKSNEIIEVNNVDALIYATYELDETTGNYIRDEIVVEFN